MATTVSEILWLRWLLQDLEVVQKHAIKLYCDNQAIRHIANNPFFMSAQNILKLTGFFVHEWVPVKFYQLLFALMIKLQTFLPNHLELRDLVYYLARWALRGVKKILYFCHVYLSLSPNFLVSYMVSFYTLSCILFKLLAD